jgi:hypothetical protein
MSEFIIAAKNGDMATLRQLIPSANINEADKVTNKLVFFVVVERHS